MRQWRSRKKITPRSPIVRKSGERRNGVEKIEPGKKMSMSVKCMIFHEGRILLLQKKDREGLLPWEFPGGGLEFGENLAQAAMREVKEETGLSITLLDIAGLWSYARTKYHFLTGVIYIAEAASDAVKLSHEHTDYIWVKPEHIYEYPLQPSLKEALDALQPTSERGHVLLEYFVTDYGKGEGAVSRNGEETASRKGCMPHQGETAHE